MIIITIGVSYKKKLHIFIDQWQKRTIFS